MLYCCAVVASAAVSTTASEASLRAGAQQDDREHRFCIHVGAADGESEAFHSVRLIEALPPVGGAFLSAQVAH